ncbi:MAG: hypothetical protein Q6363_003715 [Candidatus Njordarchaeota archaeon]
MNNLISFLLAYRIIYETGFSEILIPESKIVGISRDLELGFKCGKDIYKVAKNYKNIIQVVYTQQGRYYKIRQHYWNALFELTKNAVNFEPIKLSIARGKNLVDGMILRLTGVYNVFSLRWLQTFLFQATLIDIENNAHKEYIGHIRCMWKQCKKMGEELNFSSIKSLRKVMTTPHIKYLVVYLIKNANNVSFRLRNLIDAILFFSFEIFGYKNVRQIENKILINTRSEQIIINLTNNNTKIT